MGSGAGGGTVTKVLADLGVSVLLMEAGPMLNMADLSGVETQNVVAGDQVMAEWQQVGIGVVQCGDGLHVRIQVVQGLAGADALSAP